MCPTKHKKMFQKTYLYNNFTSRFGSSLGCLLVSSPLDLLLLVLRPGELVLRLVRIGDIVEPEPDG